MSVHFSQQNRSHYTDNNQKIYVTFCMIYLHIKPIKNEHFPIFTSLMLYANDLKTLYTFHGQTKFQASIVYMQMLLHGMTRNLLCFKENLTL